MIRQPRRRVLLWLIFSNTVLVALYMTACQRDNAPTCPLFEVGAIEGFVRSAGQGVAVRMQFRNYPGQGPRYLDCGTESDSTGWYHLELPTGLYRLEISGAHGMYYLISCRDSIRITPSIHRCDIDHCRAEITVSVPVEFEDRSFDLKLKSQNSSYSFYPGRVEAGSVRFVSSLLPAGTYHMELHHSRPSGTFYLPGTLDRTAADSLIVTPDTVITYGCDFSTKYAAISGQVNGSWQVASVGRPEVEVITADSLRLGYGRCDLDGSFTVGVFHPQPVRLRVSYAGIVQWLGGDSYETARVFDLQPGDRVNDVEFRESGMQVWLEGPADLVRHEARAFIQDEFGNELISNYHARNSFSICNLPPGRYYLQLDGRCDGQIWIPQWYDGAETLASATPIDLAEGELEQITVTLVEGGRIEGSVLSADGQPLPTSICALFDAEGQPFCQGWRQWIEFAGGGFSFAGLSNGEYYLATRQYSNDTWWYPGTEHLTEATPIVISELATVSGITWSLRSNAQAVQP